MENKADLKNKGVLSTKRRDLIKASIIAVSAGSLALSGCGNEEKKDKTENITSDDDFNIIPKQTDVYKISAPLIFDYKGIDEAASWNKKYKKSKITTLYNSIPWPQAEKFNEWFMLYRGRGNSEIKTYQDFEKYVKYAFDKGFDVVYLMNSPKAFNDRDIEPFKKDFYNVLDNIWKTGIRKVKFANTQVAQLINEYNPNFQLSVATIMEYSNIAQYKHLLHFFPNINHICIPKDQNQNFRFLAALKKEFPKIEFEVMLGEGCLKNCPSRFSCMASSLNGHYKIGCDLTKQFPIHVGVLNGHVFPWDLGYYSSIGINSFKFPPHHQRSVDKDLPQVKSYMEALEYGEDSKHLKTYIEKQVGNIDFKELITYLPDMKYFVKNGHKCSYRCGVECNYCFECAKKLEKRLLQV